MYTYQQKLEYAMKIKRLHELYVIKDDIHLTYKYKNRNNAIANAQSLQDKIIEATIDNHVYSNADPVKHIDKTVNNIIENALVNERKRIHRREDKFVNHSVKAHTNAYSEILTNRINHEALKLDKRIEEEIHKSMYNSLSEHELKKELLDKFGETGKKRIKNIIIDGIHSNECNISFINALNEGYNYKIWINGRSKGRTRAWHKAKLIAPVPIEDYFDIYGSYHAQLMYPGDLNGGAENVANCRCWLRYTNNTPSNLKKKNTFNIPNTSFLSTQNNPRNINNGGSVKAKPLKTIKTTISDTTKKVTSKIKKIGKKITTKIRTPKINTKKFNAKIKEQKNNSKNNSKNTRFRRDLSKSVTVDNKKAYGVKENPKDRQAFSKKYGIQESELTKNENKFIKLYSGEGFSYLNDYLREVKGVRHPLRRRKIYKKYSKLWDEFFKDQLCYMPMKKTIRVGKQLFKKCKILENDLVIVRRQKDSLTNYMKNGIYNNDAFLSTSISKEITEYGEYVNYIRIPKGEKILYIESVTSISGEYEIILQPGTKLKYLRQRSNRLYEWAM